MTSPRRSLTRTLAEIAHALESPQDVEIRLRTVLELLQDLVPYDYCALLRTGDDRVPTGAVRKADARSLPYLEKEGVAWIEKRNCLSCHHVPFLLWSHNEARARGITVDQKKLDGWIKRDLLWRQVWEYLVAGPSLSPRTLR